MHNLRLDRRALLALGASALSPAVARADLLRLTSRPENYEAPRSAFTERITRLEDFYIRSHFDRPTIDLATWRLKIAGLAGRPLELSYADLRKMPQVEVEAVLQCAGNGRALLRPRIPGVQWSRGAMANARWSGVRLADLLKRASPKKTAQHLVLRGADRPTLPATPAFIRSIPLAKALHPDTLVATHMNGAPLTPSHGFPARLVVPAWVGDDWVKWLDELALTEHEATGFFSEKAYRFPDPPGAPGEAMPPERMKPMTAINVKSVIARPEPGAIVPPGRVEVVGVAFSGESPVKTVEVGFADRWTAATLEGERTKYGWRVFRAMLELSAGKYVIGARATDESGATQPTQPVWNPSGYLFNAIDPVEVEVSA